MKEKKKRRRRKNRVMCICNPNYPSDGLQAVETNRGIQMFSKDSTGNPCSDGEDEPGNLT